MSPSSARDLTIPELLRVLTQKFDDEYSRIRGMLSLPILPVALLEQEVSEACRVCQTSPERSGLILRSSTDHEPRNHRPKCLDIHPILTEYAATSQQVAAGDPFPHRSRCSWAFGPRREEGSSTHSRVPILARINHRGSRKLVNDIQRQRVLGGFEPGTIKGGPSGYHP